VQAGDVALGVVPLENSTNGAVVFTLDLLADRSNRYPDVNICGEAYLDVHHCLLGKKDLHPSISSPIMSGACTPTVSEPAPEEPRTAPLYSLKHIKRLLSHPQAFGQCEAFLGKYLRGVERIDVSSTSKAAEMVKEDVSGTSAAIASSLAADIHDLDTLAKGIEDREDNKTRFLIIKKGTEPPAGFGDKAKTMISFTIDHRKPGALADALMCFGRFGINLTSINSRPTRIVPFEYIFFVEFGGTKFQDRSGRVKKTMEALSGYVYSCRVWGSWEDKLA
jgi:prephenate dehydratase